MRAALTSVVALVLGVCILLGVQTLAFAFECPPDMDAALCTWRKTGMTDLEAKNMRNIMAQMAEQPPPHPDVGLRFGSGQQARGAFGRALQKATTKIPQKAGKAGLATGAATLGLTMWYLAESGQQEGFRGNLSLSRASGQPYAKYYSDRTSSATLLGSGIITGWTIRSTPNGIEVDVSYSGKAADANPSHVYGKFGIMGPASAEPLLQQEYYPSPYTWGAATAATGGSPQGIYKLYTRDYMGPNDAEKRVFYEYTWGSGTVTETAPSPQLDAVSSPESIPAEYTPPADDAVLTPEETRLVYDYMRNDAEYQAHPDESNWSDPNYSPDPETLHGPVEWTRENPDGSTTTRYKDGTEVTVWPDGYTYTQPSTGTGSWTAPDGSTLPDTQPAPHTPPQHNGAPEPTYGCPIPPKADFDLPESGVDSPFPFSLILAFFELLDSLVAPPQAPSMMLPEEYGSGISFAMADPYMETWRDIMKVAMGLAFLVGLYRMVSQSRSD